MGRVCSENCNECEVYNQLNPDLRRMVQKIFNDMIGKFGEDAVYEIVEKNCPNLTCCPNCHIDDFCHYEGCEFYRGNEEKLRNW